MIRVLVVEDSLTVRARLVEILSGQPDLAVVGEAGDGKRAIEMCQRLRPDVITLDLALPEINGLGVTEQIMSATPTPILVVSASINRGEVHDTYQALAAGAVDVLDKPGEDDVDWEQRFLAAVRMVARIKVITHPRARLGAFARVKAPSSPPAIVQPPAKIDVVALGASTGGPGALATAIGHLPASFALPIVVVLHIDPAFAPSFADWLAQRTGKVVRLAREDDVLDAYSGRVLVAPPSAHLTIARGRVRLVAGAPRNYCRPSIDVLFESLAADRGARTLACLFTGMGRDGAAGLLAIRRAGGVTIAQDEESSVVFGMPREAILLGAAERVLSLDAIGPMIDILARQP